MDTFYNINNSNSMVIINEKEVLLNLVEGKNIIKVYSNDIFNNVENVVDKYIYYIKNEEQRIPRLKIKVTPESYDIDVEFNENRGLEKLDLKVPTYRLNFINNEGVLFNSVKNLDLLREFSIEINDEFGMKVSKPYIINEVLLNNILKSKANINDYISFLNQLGIDINKNSWEKPAIFKVIESFNAIDERELHKSFNMGIGLVMVVEKDKAEEVVNFINNREEEIHVDAKYTELMKDRAYIIGEVVDTHEGVNLC